MDTAAQHKAEPKNDDPEAGEPASQAAAVGTMSKTTAKMTLSAPADNSDLQNESDNTPADRFEVKKVSHPHALERSCLALPQSDVSTNLASIKLLVFGLGVSRADSAPTCDAE